jgi:group I intron endonuclease
MPWLIYETTNTHNGKKYVGVHFQERPGFDGYLGSGQLLAKAIAKYGRDSFERRTLHEFATADEAYAKEAELVSLQWVGDTTNYNLKGGGLGGMGFSMPEEAKQKIREYRTGRPHTDEAKQKIREYRTGRPHTEETKRKISESKIKFHERGRRAA